MKFFILFYIMNKFEKKINNKPEPEEEEEEDYFDEPTNLDKWRYTLETTVLLLILFNKYTFKLMQKLLGKCIKIASKDGNPTICGFLIHAAVFTLLLRGLMELDI